MKNKNLWLVVIVGAAAVGWLVYLGSKPVPPSKYDAFAQCIKDSGAVFYGAFWCPHCQAQKAMFEGAAQYLPYVECSNPDRSQNAFCNSKNVQSYPTWDFKDGSRETGEVPLATLAQKTGCALPQ